MEALRFEFDLAKRRMEKELSRCTKLEDKGLRVLFGGYYKREDQIRDQFDKVMKEHNNKLSEEEVFRVLESQESRSIKSRLLEAH